MPSSAGDTNTFLVLTPLQLINALEAKAFFGTRNNTLVVLRHTSLGYPVSMFKRLIEPGDWDRIYFLSTYDDESVTRVPVPRWTYLCYLQRKRLDKLAASLGATQNLFVGQYHEPIARHFSNVLPYRALYLIDDGTSTLETNDERNQVADPRTMTKKLKALVIHKLIGLRAGQAERLTFFTAYAIDARPGDTVVPNRYVHFRNRVAAAPSNGEVWFLGEPLVMDGYLSEETYLGYLGSVRRYYGDNIVYLPHNREQAADVGRVQTTLGCEVRRFGLPIEVALSRADRHPDHVVSFISSALPNCHIMFGQTLQLTAFYLKPEHLVRHHVYVEAIYQYFRREADASFEVLELEHAPGPLGAAEPGENVKPTEQSTKAAQSR